MENLKEILGLRPVERRPEIGDRPFWMRHCAQDVYLGTTMVQQRHVDFYRNTTTGVLQYVARVGDGTSEQTAVPYATLTMVAIHDSPLIMTLRSLSIIDNAYCGSVEQGYALFGGVGGVSVIPSPLLSNAETAAVMSIGERAKERFGSVHNHDPLAVMDGFILSELRGLASVAPYVYGRWYDCMVVNHEHVAPRFS